MAEKIHLFGKGPRGGDVYCFHCPGCEHSHPVEVNCAEKGWSWNGSLEAPTFSPSLLVWASRPEQRCHSFIREGKIQFLNDSFHKLAGQTVDIPDWEDKD